MRELYDVPQVKPRGIAHSTRNISLQTLISSIARTQRKKWSLTNSSYLQYTRTLVSRNHARQSNVKKGGHRGKVESIRYMVLAVAAKRQQT